MHSPFHRLGARKAACNGLRELPRSGDSHMIRPIKNAGSSCPTSQKPRAGSASLSEGEGAQPGQRIEVLVSEWWQGVHSEAGTGVWDVGLRGAAPKSCLLMYI